MAKIISTKQKNHLEKICLARIYSGEFRYLQPRTDENGIDRRFLHIAHFLAEFRVSTKKILIDLGCTDRDLADWKKQGLIENSRHLYKPSIHSKKPKIVGIYLLKTKGFKYLKRYHPYWSGLFETWYKHSCQILGLEPIFKTPHIAKNPTNSHMFEHEIGVQTIVLKKYLETEPHSFESPFDFEYIIFGKASIDAKINHALGLIQPSSEYSWKYDAILVDNIFLKDESWVVNAMRQEIYSNMLMQLDNLVEAEKQNWQQNYYWDNEFSPKNLANFKKNKLNELHDYINSLIENSPKRILIEFERSAKKQEEYDNFFAKIFKSINYLAEINIVVHSSLENKIINEYKHRENGSTQWHRNGLKTFIPNYNELNLLFFYKTTDSEIVEQAGFKFKNS